MRLFQLRQEEEQPSAITVLALSDALILDADKLYSSGVHQLYFAIALREWLFIPAGEGRPPRATPRPEEILLLARGHFELFQRLGVIAPPYHLIRARELFAQFYSGGFVTQGGAGINEIENLVEYCKVLQHCGDMEGAFDVITAVLSACDSPADNSTLLTNDGENGESAISAFIASNYANYLFYAGVISKALNNHERANSFFFDAAQAGPPRFFNKLEMMVLISRTIEELQALSGNAGGGGGGGDAAMNNGSSEVANILGVSDENDAYAMVHAHMILDGHIPEDVDCEDWISDAQTWLSLADKCAAHHMFSLATDLYGLAITRDPDAFLRPRLWYRFAKSCARCGRGNDAVLAVKQALTRAPHLQQLLQAETAWQILAEQTSPNADTNISIGNKTQNEDGGDVALRDTEVDEAKDGQTLSQLPAMPLLLKLSKPFSSVTTLQKIVSLLPMSGVMKPQTVRTLGVLQAWVKGHFQRRDWAAARHLQAHTLAQQQLQHAKPVTQHSEENEGNNEEEENIGSKLVRKDNALSTVELKAFMKRKPRRIQGRCVLLIHKADGGLSGLGISTNASWMGQVTRLNLYDLSLATTSTTHGLMLPHIVAPAQRGGHSVHATQRLRLYMEACQLPYQTVPAEGAECRFSDFVLVTVSYEEASSSNETGHYFRHLILRVSPDAAEPSSLEQHSHTHPAHRSHGHHHQHHGVVREEVAQAAHRLLHGYHPASSSSINQTETNKADQSATQSWLFHVQLVSSYVWQEEARKEKEPVQLPPHCYDPGSPAADSTPVVTTSWLDTVYTNIECLSVCRMGFAFSPSSSLSPDASSNPDLWMLHATQARSVTHLDLFHVTSQRNVLIVLPREHLHRALCWDKLLRRFLNRLCRNDVIAEALCRGNVPSKVTDDNALACEVIFPLSANPAAEHHGVFDCQLRFVTRGKGLVIVVHNRDASCPVFAEAFEVYLPRYPVQPGSLNNDAGFIDGVASLGRLESRKSARVRSTQAALQGHIEDLFFQPEGFEYLIPIVPEPETEEPAKVVEIEPEMEPVVEPEEVKSEAKGEAEDEGVELGDDLKVSDELPTEVSEGSALPIIEDEALLETISAVVRELIEHALAAEEAKREQEVVETPLVVSEATPEIVVEESVPEPVVEAVPIPEPVADASTVAISTPVKESKESVSLSIDVSPEKTIASVGDEKKKELTEEEDRGSSAPQSAESSPEKDASLQQAATPSSSSSSVKRKKLVTSNSRKKSVKSSSASMRGSKMIMTSTSESEDDGNDEVRRAAEEVQRNLQLDEQTKAREEAAAAEEAERKRKQEEEELAAAAELLRLQAEAERIEQLVNSTLLRVEHTVEAKEGEEQDVDTSAESADEDNEDTMGLYDYLIADILSDALAVDHSFAEDLLHSLYLPELLRALVREAQQEVAYENRINDGCLQVQKLLLKTVLAETMMSTVRRVLHACRVADFALNQEIIPRACEGIAMEREDFDAPNVDYYGNDNHSLLSQSAYSNGGALYSLTGPISQRPHAVFRTPHLKLLHVTSQDAKKPHSRDSSRGGNTRNTLTPLLHRHVRRQPRTSNQAIATDLLFPPNHHHQQSDILQSATFPPPAHALGHLSHQSSHASNLLFNNSNSNVIPTGMEVFSHTNTIFPMDSGASVASSLSSYTAGNKYIDPQPPTAFAFQTAEELRQTLSASQSMGFLVGDLDQQSLQSSLGSSVSGAVSSLSALESFLILPNLHKQPSLHRKRKHAKKVLFSSGLNPVHGTDAQLQQNNPDAALMNLLTINHSSHSSGRMFREESSSEDSNSRHPSRASSLSATKSGFLSLGNSMDSNEDDNNSNGASKANAAQYAKSQSMRLLMQHQQSTLSSHHKKKHYAEDLLEHHIDAYHHGVNEDAELANTPGTPLNQQQITRSLSSHSWQAGRFSIERPILQRNHHPPTSSAYDNLFAEEHALLQAQEENDEDEDEDKNRVDSDEELTADYSDDFTAQTTPSVPSAMNPAMKKASSRLHKEALNNSSNQKKGKKVNPLSAISDSFKGVESDGEGTDLVAMLSHIINGDTAPKVTRAFKSSSDLQRQGSSKSNHGESKPDTTWLRGHRREFIAQYGEGPEDGLYIQSLKQVQRLGYVPTMEIGTEKLAKKRPWAYAAHWYVLTKRFCISFITLMSCPLHMFHRQRLLAEFLASHAVEQGGAGAFYRLRKMLRTLHRALCATDVTVPLLQLPADSSNAHNNDNNHSNTGSPQKTQLTRVASAHALSPSKSQQLHAQNERPKVTAVSDSTTGSGLSLEELICALAETQGSVGAALVKLQDCDLEFLSEIRLVCGTVNVRALVCALPQGPSFFAQMQESLSNAHSAVNAAGVQHLRDATNATSHHSSTTNSSPHHSPLSRSSTMQKSQRFVLPADESDSFSPTKSSRSLFRHSSRLTNNNNSDDDNSSVGSSSLKAPYLKSARSRASLHGSTDFSVDSTSSTQSIMPLHNAVLDGRPETLPSLKDRTSAQELPQLHLTTQSASVLRHASVVTLQKYDNNSSNGSAAHPNSKASAASSGNASLARSASSLKLPPVHASDQASPAPKATAAKKKTSGLFVSTDHEDDGQGSIQPDVSQSRHENTSSMMPHILQRSVTFAAHLNADDDGDLYDEGDSPVPPPFKPTTTSAMRSSTNNSNTSPNNTFTNSNPSSTSTGTTSNATTMNRGNSSSSLPLPTKDSLAQQLLHAAGVFSPVQSPIGAAPVGTMSKQRSFRLQEEVVERLYAEQMAAPVMVLCRRDALKARQEEILLKSDKLYIRDPIQRKLQRAATTTSIAALHQQGQGPVVRGGFGKRATSQLRLLDSVGEEEGK